MQNKKKNELKKIESIYIFITLLFWLAFAIPMSVYILIIKTRGTTLFQIGMIIAIYSLVMVLMEIPTGGLADSIGRKKVALAAFAFITLGLVCILFSHNFIFLLIAMIIFGIGRALYSGTLDAWFVDELQRIDPEINLQPVFARVGIIVLLTMAGGTFLGSLIPKIFAFLPPEPALLTPLSVTLIFSISVMLAVLLFTAILVKDPRSNSREKGLVRGFKAVPGIITRAAMLTKENHIILLLFAAGSFTLLASGSLETYAQPFFAGLIKNPLENTYILGIILGTNILFSACGNMLSIPLGKALKKQFALAAFLFQVIMLGAMVILVYQTDLLLAALCFWFTHMAIAGIGSYRKTLLNKQIPEEYRSSMLSIASFARYLGSLGGIGIGYLADKISISAAWLAGAVLLAIPCISYLRIHTGQKKKSLPH